MKNHTQNLFVTVAFVALSIFIAVPSSLEAQGSLTPPGAPVPTMKTLAQIEPRTPISSAPFTISVPGSFYLTTNVTVGSGDAITIAAGGVTLDLNGFTISSTAPSAGGSAIGSNGGLTNITILNGFIAGGVTNLAGAFSGSGFGYGLYLPAGFNVRASGVTVSGCLMDGIHLNPSSSLVESCTVNTAGGAGIYAQVVFASSALNCWSIGIYSEEANNCFGESLTFDGLYAFTANNCRGDSHSATYPGISAIQAINCYGNCYSGGNGVDAGTAENCQGGSTSGTGVNANVAINCSGSSNTGTGLNATSAQNCFGNSQDSTGLNANTAQNCYGNCTSSSVVSTGLNATTAENCSGYSLLGTGLYAVRTATSCYGQSYSGTGLYVYTGVATGSFGYSSFGTGLQAYVANGCFGQNLSGLSEFIAYKYNMP